MTNNNNMTIVHGELRFEDINIKIENGERKVIPLKIAYMGTWDPFDLEAEMEADRKKYEAMKWYNKTFCNARD